MMGLTLLGLFGLFAIALLVLATPAVIQESAQTVAKEIGQKTARKFL